MHQTELIPHLFRTEFRKICAALSKHFGIDRIGLAEDITSEVFVQALDTWTYKGIPENPTAWLYAVAKNKAKNHLHRQHLFSEKIVKEIVPDTIMEPDLSEPTISDSQLQMLFAICHPSLPTESQIGLALRLLCGFGIEEIANAFLTNKEVINKRLYRAREKLREENIRIELPSDKEMNDRLDTVLTTLYLLFNEGYYSESDDDVLREDLCLEAMRLANLLLENEKTKQPKVNALLALMCFHASRFPARKNARGKIILYADQDERLWNRDLISKGAGFLHRASQGAQVTKYHLEASIAYWHTIKTDTSDKWEKILQLYNHLLQLEYSPMAALNRTYALSKVQGKEVALTEAQKLKLHDNPYYHALLGELFSGRDDKKAKHHFVQAHALSKTRADREIISEKIAQLPV
jgi:RNA polymerase sigma factor (sigma-70 family)